MKRLLQIFLPFAIVAASVMLALTLINSKPKAASEPAPERVSLVQVRAVVPGSHRVTVEAAGTVTPARTLVVQPELSGRVLEHHPALVAGGRVKAGEVLLRIDDRDYRLAAAQQAANLAMVKTELKVEKGRRRVAEREWSLVNPTGEGSDEGRELALRAPQQVAVKASISAARSALDRARLAVDKAELVAPFNALVSEESVEVGQLVAPASRLATLVGTDRYWVEVSLPVDRLHWIDVPGVSTAGERGSAVKVIQEVGRARIERTGWVARLRGELDPLGKMARVVVAVDNPLGLSADGATTQDIPLLLGAYVTVEIAGGELTDVVRIPREALRDGDKVWLMDADSRLAIEAVEVRWKTAESAFVAGLSKGDRLITGRVATPVVGLKLALDEGAPATVQARRAPSPAAADASPPAAPPAAHAVVDAPAGEAREARP
jgi:RND family efflux transporter MFP subunit